MNLNELLSEYRRRANAAGLQCDVLGHGTTDARIAIVAEAPGPREVDMKTPLVGGSGRFLWEVLRKYNINRNTCYTTNVIKRQVSTGDDDERIGVSGEEFNRWADLLQWELKQLPNLKYVLVMGGAALKALTGHDKIRNWRGSVTELNGVHYVFTTNPADVLRNPETEVVFRFDIAKLDRVMKGEYRGHSITARINPSPDEALRWIARMRREGLPVAYDIETIAGETACIGLANDAHEGMCIAFRTRSANVYSVRDELRVRLALQDLFNEVAVKLVAQNGNFDAYWLWFKDRIRVSRNWFDTLLAHHTLYPTLPHDLGFLTAQYTDHPYYKDERTEWREGSDIDTFWNYNVKDCCITLACQQRLHHELRQSKLDSFYYNHVMRLQPHLTRMTVNGVLADVTLKDEITGELLKRVHELEDEFHTAVREATGDPTYVVSPRSNVQLGDLFFNKLGLTGRGTSVAKANRVRMLSTASPTAANVIRRLDVYATEQKFLSTYAESQVDVDGRLRCEYKQFGTQSAPGRLSSSMTMWKSGMNLQNQPKRAQKMFICPPGYGFVYFDLSQAEARVVAHAWQVKGLLENFKRADVDVHRANASRIFRVPYENVPAVDWNEDGTPTIRYLGKRCVHGLNYRMGADKLAEACSIAIAQAMDAYYMYHAAFPEIKIAWDNIIATVKRTRELWTPMGRRQKWLGRLDADDALDSVIAFVPQSTIGDKVSSVIYQSHDDPKWPSSAAMCLNIHDALIAVAPLDQREQCAKVMKRYAEAPITIRGESVSIPAEFSFSQPDEGGVHRWSTLQKMK